MGLFSNIFGRQKRRDVYRYFESLSGYTPVFTTFDGGVYEMELTRAAIHAFANACSKLRPEVHGAARENLEKILQFRPNPYMDTGKFLYRLATIYSIKNNAFIVPVLGEAGEISGYYPVLPSNAEVLEINGEAFMRFTFASGERVAIEYGKVGHLTQFHYKDDFFGADNSPLKSTMQLIHTQNQGIENAVKNSAVFRFLARIGGKHDPAHVKKERDRFARENFSEDNKSGLIVHDGTFMDFTQIDSKPYTANHAQMKLINENVFNYFGVSEAILQNKFTDEEWTSYYRGKVAPFANALSLALTNMTYTWREIAHGNMITVNTDPKQHISDKQKMELFTTGIDRGLLTINEARALLGWPSVDGGDVRVVRREYVEFDKMGLRDMVKKQELGIEPEGGEGGDENADSEG